VKHSLARRRFAKVAPVPVIFAVAPASAIIGIFVSQLINESISYFSNVVGTLVIRFFVGNCLLSPSVKEF